MKNRLLILLMFSIALFSCSEDDSIGSPKNTIKIDNVNYALPIITTNVSELQTYLTTLTNDVEVIQEGNDIIVKAKMSSDDKNLFTSFHYVFLSGGAKGVTLTYKFNEAKSITLTMKRDIMHSINEKNKVII